MENGNNGYERINGAFKTLSRVLFKREIGELGEFAEYLNEYTLPRKAGKSGISGKEVILTTDYPEGARVISQDEVGKLEFTPVEVNKIKDIDSLLEAVGENAVYCGNRVFGKNSNILRSDNVTNCHDVMEAQEVFHSKYCAYIAESRECEYCFGFFAHPFAKFCMRCVWGKDVARCFETYYCNNASDCMFCYNTSGCIESMFSFNQRGKRYVIGNLELPRDRYMEIKEKLVGEIADELAKNKRMPSLIEIPRKYGGLGKEVPEFSEGEDEDGGRAARISVAFASATKLVLGAELGPITRYEKWLQRYGLPIKRVRSVSGGLTHRVEKIPGIKDVPQERFMGDAEALEAGREKKLEPERYTLEGLRAGLSEIAYFTHEMRSGQSTGIVDTPITYSSHDIYKVFDSTESRHCGCTFAPVGGCEYVFGGKYRMLKSKFCINCYEPVDLASCFEVDSSYSSTNCYFCHNVENVDGGIFCFNVKGKRYAVGNTEVGKEEFMRIKKILLDYVVGELEKKGELELSILNMEK